MYLNQSSTNSPWGTDFHPAFIAEGIRGFTTSTHGGFGLSVERLATMPAPLRAISPFAGTGWYEEDVDWCLVVLAFPDCFSDSDCFHAIRTARGAPFAALVDWDTFLAHTPEGLLCTERAARDAALNADKYDPAGFSTDGALATLTGVHRTTGERIVVTCLPGTEDNNLYRPFSLADAEALIRHGGSIQRNA